MAGVIFNLMKHETFWGPLVGLLTFLLLVYVTGHLGFSLIMAGLFGAVGGYETNLQ